MVNRKLYIVIYLLTYERKGAPVLAETLTVII